MTDAYFWRKDRPIPVEPELHGEVGSWERLFGLTPEQWAKELRRTSRRRRKPLTAVDKAREMLADYGEHTDEEKVAALAQTLSADKQKADATSAAAEPFGKRAQLETLDWTAHSAAEIVALIREPYALTKNETVRLLLLDGRFDTNTIIAAVGVQPGVVSNQRTALKRDYEAGRLSRPLPRSVTHARSDYLKGTVRHDLRRDKKMPVPGKSARAYGDGRNAHRRKDEESEI